LVAQAVGNGIVGRRREQAALVSALARLRFRRTSWLTVAGEAGIGKTRLLASLVDEAEARGHLVLTGRGVELERELPFGIWVDALDDFAAGLGRERLERLARGQLVELGRVLPAAAEGAPEPGGLQPERYRAHRAVRSLLQGLAGNASGLVLVLDDVHWADDASVELIEHLLRRPPAAAVLIVLAHRAGQAPVPLTAALTAAARESHVTEVVLEPLSGDEAGELLGERVPAPLREALYRQSGGNPFYLEELARAPLAHGAAGMMAADGEPVHVPTAVAAALGEEIERLPDAARRLAWGAALAGDPAELELAAAAAELSPDAALGAIDELLAAGVLLPTSVPRRYGFRHPIVRRAVYEAASEAWRLRAHARVADALADRPRALAARAHHLELCAAVGDEAALAVLEQAGHEAAPRAPAVAARRFAAALRLLAGEDDDPSVAGRRLGLLIALASAEAATGDLEGALEHLQETLTLVDPGAVEVLGALVALCAACENLLGRHDAAHARLLRALEALPAERPAAVASLHAELAADALYDSDFAAMADWAERAETAAGALGARPLEALACALGCFAAYGLGRPSDRDSARTRAATLVDGLSDDELPARLDAIHYLGFAEYFCERYDDAIRHLERGIAVSRAVGHGQFLIPMMVGLAHALETRGRLEEAVETATAAVEAARLSANRQITGFALVAEAMTRGSVGDVAGALAAGDEAVALLEGLDPSVLTVATHAHVGVTWMDIGEPQRCLDQMDAIGDEAFALIEPGRRGWLYAVMARAQLELGHRDEAERLLERSDELGRGLELPLFDAWLLHARGLLALADGDDERAAALAVEAAECADHVHAAVAAARCRTLAGTALGRLGRRDEATAALTRAEQELGAAGAARHRDEAARELRRLGRRVPGRQRRTAGEGLAGLSGREREIADRVALGRTNREIAEELFLSPKTIEGHLTTVFAKLGVTSRAEVAEAVGRARSA
jgi:ATP/maltotriose-dependent transcriptional regulator MalT